MRSFREPNTHHSATASCPASTSTLSGQRCSTHKEGRNPSLDLPEAATGIGTTSPPPPPPRRGPIRGAWKNSAGNLYAVRPFPVKPAMAFGSRAAVFAQHLPAGWATLVWRCLVQEAGVLRLTRKDPDHLPATAAQNSIIPGRGLLALRHRVALLWDREGPFLLHPSGQRGVASPSTQGPAPPRLGARVPDPPRNGRRGRNLYTVQASQAAAFLPLSHADDGLLLSHLLQ